MAATLEKVVCWECQGVFLLKNLKVHFARHHIHKQLKYRSTGNKNVADFFRSSELQPAKKQKIDSTTPLTCASQSTPESDSLPVSLHDSPICLGSGDVENLRKVIQADLVHQELSAKVSYLSMMLRHQEPWLLSSVDLTAKLQACEIELECTRQEVVKKDVQLQQCKSTLDFKDKQIKAQARRQHDVERIHKELIQEYEQQVISLRKEIESIKLAQEQVRSNFMDLQSKYSSEQRNCNSSCRLLEAIDMLDKRLRSSSAVLPSPGLTAGETADILKENYHHLQEKLKTIQLDRPQKQDSLDLLQEEVHHSLTVTKDVMDQLMALEASIQALKGPVKLDEYSVSGQPWINSQTKRVADQSDTSPIIPQWFDDWSANLESGVPNTAFSIEETNHVEQLKEKISIHVNTLECLIGRIVQKQLLRNLLSNP